MPPLGHFSIAPIIIKEYVCIVIKAAATKFKPSDVQKKNIMRGKVRQLAENKTLAAIH